MRMMIVKMALAVGDSAVDEERVEWWEKAKVILL
jgi:hypothetical protein